MANNNLSLLTGFTLSELLISLLVLGLVATFIIPKVLTSITDVNIVQWKETLTNVNNVFYDACQNQNLRNDAQINTYLLNNLNAAKKCLTSAHANGCWVSPPMRATGQNSPGLVLHNGSYIMMASASMGSPSLYFFMMIDINGPEPPNLEGTDLIRLVSVYRDPVTFAAWIDASSYRPCALFPYGTDSAILWKKVYN